MQYPFSPLPHILTGIEAAMSPARLARFRSLPSPDKNLALRMYVWNARLCEEFYIPLQFTEVALRNGIHRRLEQSFGANWYKNQKFSSVIPNRHKEDLANVVTAETAKRGTSFTVDHVVAGLPFGFWQNLMGRGLAHILWKYNANAVFPHAPAGTKRETIFEMLERLRKFRNSVMHHYAIFDKNPVTEYNNIRTLMSWMCPHTLWLMSELANPAGVLARRPTC
ncbi:hypothetical protein ACVII1_007121 [Bradyrhizobium elkanii]